MNILTKETIKALEPAESYFRQVQHGYKRNSSHALDVQVYEALKSVNPNEPKPNYSCSKCIYNLYKRASEIYFNSKEKIDDGKEKNIKKNSTTTTTTEPKRRGRRPKN